MNDGRGERRGTLFVRVWVDEESSAPILIRMVEVIAAPAEERTVAVAGSVADACDALRAWLEDVAARDV